MPRYAMVIVIEEVESDYAYERVADQAQLSLPGLKFVSSPFEIWEVGDGECSTTDDVLKQRPREEASR